MGVLATPIPLGEVGISETCPFSQALSDPRSRKPTPNRTALPGMQRLLQLSAEASVDSAAADGDYLSAAAGDDAESGLISLCSA